MKNVKLVTKIDGYGNYVVELWIDGGPVQNFIFKKKTESKAFIDGFRECEARFCRLDPVE